MFGKKTFIIDGKDIVVNANETITIPANVEHAATNNYDSVMLSIGD
jgi:quercetin dioxygenase-like cupin family protein